VGAGVGLGLGVGVGDGVGEGVGSGVGDGVGLGVGFAVGAVVGRGVRVAVGRAVGVGEKPPAWTSTRITIPARTPSASAAITGPRYDRRRRGGSGAYAGRRPVRCTGTCWV